MNQTEKKNLINIIKEAKTEWYKPIPFWSINSKLEKNEIVRQIEEMYSYGLGGFVFHARTGLATEYLSEEWFEMVELSLDTAKRLGMKVWLYDENGWPSGFIGGKLLEDEANRAAYLRYAVKDEYDENAYAVYAYDSEHGARLLAKNETADRYHTIYRMKSNAYTDILNPKVTDRFIAGVYEQYYQRFGDRFGKEFVGFFTDEPQYYRYETPISAVTEEEYFASYGKDLKDGLLYLFIQDERGYAFRCEYYNLMNRLYCENYYKRLTDWCEERGCLLTGHSVEETFMSTQMWGGADCATTYCYEHIPAIDNLEKSLTAEISAKSVGSVAAQIGKNLVFTETFGVSGYSTTPRQLKLIADKQYVYGVNMMIQHLYCYSLAGQGKIDCPPSFGRMMPWIGGYPEFNKNFERLGYLISNSRELVSVAVLTPMESVYLDYLRLDERAAAENVDQPFLQTINELRKKGIAYHFVNEKILEKIGKTEGGELIVGECAYRAVVVANCRSIKHNTNELLKKFVRDGGKLCVSGEVPRYLDGYKTEERIVANCEMKDLPLPLKITVGDAVSYTYREIAGKRFLFLVNEGKEPVRAETGLPFSPIDLLAERGYAASTNHIVPAEGSLLLEEQGAYEGKFREYNHCKTVVPQYLESDHNNLTLENITVTLQNGTKLTGYVYGIFEMLMKRGYADRLKVSFEFESDSEREVTITREKQDVENVRFNGEALAFYQADEDVNFEKAVARARSGINVYEYEVDFSSMRKGAEILYQKDVLESLLNCATYHTGMEPVYVSGDFDTEGYRLCRTKAKQAGDLTAQGLGNFYGKVCYEICLEEAISGYVKPIGAYTQCIIKVGGKEYRCMTEAGVFAELPAGKTQIECYSSLRNRFGPFHYGSPDDDRISPDTFTLRNRWEDEKTNKFYYQPKRVVPFGLERIEIEY